MRGFFRFSTRDLLILMGAVGLLLAVLSTLWRGDLTELQKAKVQQRLRVAAESGDEAAVSRALREGAELGAFENGHHEALQAAIMRGQVGALNVMIGAGCDVTHPMHVNLAVTTNQPEALQRLIAAVGTENLENAARKATQHGHLESLKVLLDAGAMGSLYDVSLQPFALYSRSNQNRLDAARLLLERLKRAARDSGYDDSRELAAALERSVRTNDAELAELLREFGSRLTLREEIVFDQLDQVRKMLDEHPELLPKRLKREDGLYQDREPTPLGLALKLARRNIALELIARGAPLRERERNDDTLLHLAAMGGDPVLVKLLIDKGLSVNAVSDNGYPLNYAVETRHTDAARVLIQAGASVYPRGHSSLLHDAARSNNPEIARLLLDAGANPAVVDREGKTPRDIAVQFRRQEVLEVFDEALRARAESDSAAANSASDPANSFEQNEEEKRQSLP
jgi:hypothetical protein